MTGIRHDREEEAGRKGAVMVPSSNDDLEEKHNGTSHSGGEHVNQVHTVGKDNPSLLSSTTSLLDSEKPATATPIDASLDETLTSIFDDDQNENIASIPDVVAHGKSRAHHRGRIRPDICSRGRSLNDADDDDSNGTSSEPPWLNSPGTHSDVSGTRDDSSTSEDGISFQAFFVTPFPHKSMENAHRRRAAAGQNTVKTERDLPSVDFDESLGNWTESFTNDSLTTHNTQHLDDVHSEDPCLEHSSLAETISLHDVGFGHRLVRQDHISYGVTPAGSVYTRSSSTKLRNLRVEPETIPGLRRANSETLQIAKHSRLSWLFQKALGFVISQEPKQERQRLASYNRNAHKSERPCMCGGMAENIGEAFEQSSLNEVDVNEFHPELRQEIVDAGMTWKQAYTRQTRLVQSSRAEFDMDILEPGTALRIPLIRARESFESVDYLQLADSDSPSALVSPLGTVYEYTNIVYASTREADASRMRQAGSVITERVRRMTERNERGITEVLATVLPEALAKVITESHARDLREALEQAQEEARQAEIEEARAYAEARARDLEQALVGRRWKNFQRPFRRGIAKAKRIWYRVRRRRDADRGGDENARHQSPAPDQGSDLESPPFPPPPPAPTTPSASADNSFPETAINLLSDGRFWGDPAMLHVITGICGEDSLETLEDDDCQVHMERVEGWVPYLDHLEGGVKKLIWRWESYWTWDGKSVDDIAWASRAILRTWSPSRSQWDVGVGGSSRRYSD